MAIDFDKYILSSGTHYISNSGGDEKGGIKGGRAGDQKSEWVLKKWYNRPWSVILRHPNQAVALEIAKLSIAAPLNAKIGYDQSQRTTYWNQLKTVGYDPSKITVPCEQDCSAGVSSNVKGVGFRLGVEALQKIPICSSRNMRAQFTKAGFKALTEKKYLTSGKYLLPGDILLYERHHAAVNVTLGSAVKSNWHPENAPKPVRIYKLGERNLKKGDEGEDVREMQSALVELGFKLPKFGVDGEFGSETESAVIAFQKAVGMTSGGQKIEANGVFDQVTYRAMIDHLYHYVEITGGSVNVRKAPGVQYEVIGEVHKGDKLPYGGRVYDNGWFLVEYNGQNAAVSGKYGKLVR